VATIEDLPNKSITDMSTDEGIELMRQIRLSRRTVKESKKKKASKPKTQAKKKPPTLSPSEAKKLLAILTAEE